MIIIRSGDTTLGERWKSIRIEGRARVSERERQIFIRFNERLCASLLQSVLYEVRLLRIARECRKNRASKRSERTTERMKRLANEANGRTDERQSNGKSNVKEAVVAPGVNELDIRVRICFRSTQTSHRRGKIHTIRRA